MELNIFEVVHMVLCFIFVGRTVLIRHQCFGYCWAALLSWGLACLLSEWMKRFSSNKQGQTKGKSQSEWYPLYLMGYAGKKYYISYPAILRWLMSTDGLNTSCNALLTKRNSLVCVCLSLSVYTNINPIRMHLGKQMLQKCKLVGSLT